MLAIIKTSRYEVFVFSSASPLGLSSALQGSSNLSSFDKELSLSDVLLAFVAFKRILLASSFRPFMISHRIPSKLFESKTFKSRNRLLQRLTLRKNANINEREERGWVSDEKNGFVVSEPQGNES